MTTATAAPASKPLSLGVIFLTLYIDLIGFSIIFPLFPSSAISTLISLYRGVEEQGRVLGVFRSLGSLARAIAPVAGGLVYWRLRPEGLYVLSGMVMLVPIIMSLRLPQPER